MPSSVCFKGLWDSGKQAIMRDVGQPRKENVICMISSLCVSMKLFSVPNFQYPRIYS